MRLLFVADGRSPTASNWIRYWIERGDEVHLASSFPGESLPGLASYQFVPVAFSGLGSGAGNSYRGRGFTRSAGGVRIRQFIRHWLGPWTLPGAARQFGELVEKLKPDLVHAMRIPFEGMLAAGASLSVPLLISVWGNDFTLHARSSPWMQRLTRKTVSSAGALHADCQRDVRLARAWGLGDQCPTLVIPGNGGVHTDVFYPPGKMVSKAVVLNPRGFRAYVRNDTFFRSVPLVLEKRPGTRFICSSMAGEPLAEKWISRLNIHHAVTLLPSRTHTEMGAIFRSATVMVSPSLHDGTPNSLLEAMACGCFPVVGDIESMHEWITPGVNGLMADATRPQEFAEAILLALENGELRRKAARQNLRIVKERAGYTRCMGQAESLYRQLVGK